MSRYLVFARMQHDEPLTHQGEIEADADAAQTVALERFGDQWLEIVLIPEDEIHWVLRSQGVAQVEAAV